MRDILGEQIMKKLQPIIPHVFENYLLISIDIEWLKIFKKIPTFEVSIDNEKRLHLISNEVIAQ